MYAGILSDILSFLGSYINNVSEHQVSIAKFEATVAHSAGSHQTVSEVLPIYFCTSKEPAYDYLRHVCQSHWQKLTVRY